MSGKVRAHRRSADRAATPSGPSPETVSGIAGIPCAEDIARRCEASDEPSVELDAAIAAVAQIADNLHSYQQADKLLGVPFYRVSDDCKRVEVGTHHEDKDHIVASRAPRPFTESLDAALTLVPQAIGGRNTFPLLHKIKTNEWRAHIGVPGPVEQGTCGKGTTGPLALCAAALRARAK